MRPETEPAEVLAKLERWGAERRWVGPDPYEGLNSALGRLAPGRRARQAVIQASKRLPVAPPWPLRAAPRPNSKALALALSGYCTSAVTRLAPAEDWRERLAAQLGRLAIERPAGSLAWGYHFDAQTRHLFYASNTPNAIATCFVAGALLDLHRVSEEAAPAEMALRARPYLKSLFRGNAESSPYFAYLEPGSELIHNANVMVAGAIARLSSLEADAEGEAMAREAIATATALQPADGIWPYGERSDLGWADNFHHAYILEGLVHTEAAFGLGGEALDRGLTAWRKRFFGPGDEARFYPDRDYPLEAHSYASAIDCLCAVAAARGDREALEFADRLARAAIRDLWLPSDGRFAFKRGARGLNRREFMRWTNAPMFRALALLESAPAPASEQRQASVGSSRA